MVRDGDRGHAEGEIPNFHTLASEEKLSAKLSGFTSEHTAEPPGRSPSAESAVGAPISPVR